MKLFNLKLFKEVKRKVWDEVDPMYVHSVDQWYAQMSSQLRQARQPQVHGVSQSADLEKEAFNVEFKVEEFMMLSNDRLERLCKVYRHFNYQKKYNISFALFVKLVISDWWKVFVGEFYYNTPWEEKPPSTIKKEFKIRWYIQHHKPVRRRFSRTYLFLPYILGAFIIGVIFVSYQF